MENLKGIGGYFELDTSVMNTIGSFHPEAVVLNTGRNAFEYVLKARSAIKVYLPYFTCEVLLEPLKKMQIPFEFYNIDENLEPLFDFFVLNKNDVFLYTNYFGLKDLFIKKLSLSCSQLVIDNAQAFFSKPINNIPSFYSVRKFFGVSDGAYLYLNENLDEHFERDVSYDRMLHLLIRKDVSAEFGYSSFVSNEKLLDNQPIKRMSSITEALLENLNYYEAAKKRIYNYKYLDSFLKKSNEFCIELETDSVPMVYPYWTKDLSLRERLLKNKIYTAVYWPNVKKWVKKDSLEYQLVNEVIYLPIDQRYGTEEMNTILKIIIE